MRTGSRRVGAISRRGILAIGMVAGMVASSASRAQDIPEASERVEPPGGQMASAPDRGEGQAIDQVSESLSRSAAPRQIGPSAPVSDTPQLAPANAARAPTSQIYRGAPSAEAAAPLSRPAEGREASVVRLGGSDRCDDADAAGSRLCERAIETRAAEFERPPPTLLSPEQRLLVDQRLRAGARTVATEAQRIGQNEIDADSPEAQGLASITLPRPGEHVPGSDGKVDAQGQAPIDAAGAALILAIVEGAKTAPR